ncbi:MAG: acetyl-CoA carboxylase, carboxyltransferase subunit beta [Victivallaceae bacterium]|nr:acetyl-CoA carboxylase, carboxyltransferase subunit beta [Victivallaceae bacterium]MDD4180752.1 acetyl-CoA carboxylase, carboxyltransferase subunit beta [Victivallaceae bacterium]
MSLFRSGKYTTLKLEPNSQKKRDIPQGLWIKCQKCCMTVYKKQLDENLNVCPHCSFHCSMTAGDRIAMLTDEGSFQEIDANLISVDPLDFTDFIPYKERLEASKGKTALNEAIRCGVGTLEGRQYALGVMDFRFMGASMGSVVGEKIARLAEAAVEHKCPVVIISASGGARMQEGILSLMQMPKTCGALQRLSAAGLGFISILTNPTYGGVTASFATIGDLILAEPGAMIGFAGPRVIQETTNTKLPEGFQTAEFLLEKGLIDRVVNRKNLRHELALCLEYFIG